MILEFINSFLLGLATPLTAACVIPLYPGFLSYLSNQLDTDTSKRTFAMFGLLVVAGVMSFMMALGLVFTTLIETSLTNIIEIISPVAFSILGAMGLLMIFEVDFQRFIPSKKGAPRFGDPLLNAFSFGFFFGAIIIPCNPAFIATFFARSFLFETPFTSIMNFMMFGLGIGFPLLVFSITSSSKTRRVMELLQDNSSIIHRGSGLIMISVAVYYLVFVFQVIPF